MAQQRSPILNTENTETSLVGIPDSTLVVRNDLFGDPAEQDDFYLAWWSVSISAEEFPVKWPLIEQAISSKELWYARATRNGHAHDVKIYVPRSNLIYVAINIYKKLIELGIVEPTQKLQLEKKASIIFEDKAKPEYLSTELASQLIQSLENMIRRFDTEFEAEIDADANNVRSLNRALSLFLHQVKVQFNSLKSQGQTSYTMLSHPVFQLACKVAEKVADAVHHLACNREEDCINAIKAVANLLLARLESQIDDLPEEYNDFKSSLLQLKTELSHGLTTAENLVAVIPQIMEATMETSQMLAAVHPRGQSSGDLKAAVESYSQFSAKLNQLEATRTRSVLQKIARTVATVALAAVGFVLGAMAGCAIGLVAGIWSGPGAAVTATIGLFKGGVTGSAIALASGAAVSGLTTGVLSGYSLFQKPKLPLSTDCTNTVKAIASQAKDYIKPSV